MKLSEALASLDAYDSNQNQDTRERVSACAVAFLRQNRDRLLRMQTEDAARAAVECNERAPIVWLEGRDSAPAVDTDGIYIAELVVVGEKWSAP